MARPLRIQFPGAFYHVTCRGNKRQSIFLDNDDQHWFLKILRESLEIYQATLFCYVLMPNHFHIILQTLRANLSEFMRRFNISYTGWFNYHHNTYGHLYQGRYKALLIDADNYLLEVSRYVHLNPLRTSTFKQSTHPDPLEYINRYCSSSLPGYLDKKRIANFVDYNMVLDMVGGRREYRRFLLDGLQNGFENPFKDVQYQMILGDDSFAARIKSEYLESASLREQPVYRDIVVKKADPRIVIECVSTAFSITSDAIHTRRGSSIVRGILSEILYRYSGMTQHAIGEYLGIDYSSVNKLRSRLRKRMKDDTNLAQQYDDVVAAIKQHLSNV